MARHMFRSHDIATRKASVTTKTAALPFPTTLIVVKGCPALNVAIREHWTVKEVRELGPD